MSKVGVDNDPLLERVIFGYDGTNYRVVKIDTDGNLVAAIKASQSIEVTQDTPADLLATVIPAASEKMLSYKSSKIQRLLNASASSGDNLLTGDTVPSGEVWFITSVWAANDTRGITRIEYYAYDGSDLAPLSQKLSPALYEKIGWQGYMPITAGFYVQGSFVGCTAGDVIYLDYAAIVMATP